MAFSFPLNKKRIVVILDIILKLCVSGTKLPYQLATGLLQVHPGPGGEVLQVQQHEGGQPGQQGQGGPLPGPGGQGQTEIFLDWRTGQERPDQLAVRQEIQRRQLVQHWRVRDDGRHRVDHSLTLVQIGPLVGGFLPFTVLYQCFP